MQHKDWEETRNLSRSHSKNVSAVACQSILIALTAAAFPCASASAQPRGEMFAGKTISVVIGFDAGGSYDQYGRLVAKHFGRHLPGTPAVVPANMPGVAGLRAAAYVYEVAARDGTVLGMVAQTIALADKLGTPGIRYKASEFNWIGRVTSSVEILISWHTSKVKSVADAKAVSAPFAGTSPGAAAHDYPLVLNNVVGTKFKIIGGYQSASPMMLAMERGETEGAFTSWNTIKTARQEWLRNKTINIIVQFTEARHPDLPDVPNMVELGNSDEDKRILALYASGAIVGRSLIAPPGVPQERVAALRAGFDAMLKDKEFLAEIDRTHAEFDPMPGTELQKLVAGFDNLPAAIIERARKVRVP